MIIFHLKTIKIFEFYLKMRKSLSSTKLNYIFTNYNLFNKKTRDLSFEKSNSDKINYYVEDKSFLISTKHFLESILNNIKKSQTKILSLKLDNKISETKIILTNLIKDLSTNLKTKENNRKELEKIVRNKKDYLNREMFGKDFFFENNKKKNKRKINENESDKFHCLNVELKNLKLLNFKIENQISSINEEFDFKLFMCTYLKNVGFMIGSHREKKCEYKEDILKVDNILQKNRIDYRKKLSEMIIEKNLHYEEIISLSEKIALVKRNIYLNDKKAYKEYINSNEIIPELPSDFSNSNESNINDSKNLKIMSLIKKDELKYNFNNIININNIIKINITKEKLENEDNKLLRKRKLKNSIYNV